MEIKVNKEIKDYSESICFGLSLRQFIFSLIAVAIAIAIYFGLREKVGTETVSWMCVLGAAPFAALGFIKFQGMNAEQLLWAWIKSEILEKGPIVCEHTTAYYECTKDVVEKKEGKKRNVKNRKKNHKSA